MKRRERIARCVDVSQRTLLLQSIQNDVRTDPRGITYYWLNFRRGNRVQGPESDYDALRAGKIVVTPLRYDRTDEDAYQTLAQDLPRFNGPRSER